MNFFLNKTLCTLFELFINCNGIFYTLTYFYLDRVCLDIFILIMRLDLIENYYFM